MLVAAMATLAIGGVAVAGGGGDDNNKKKKKAKFDSQITLNYNQGPYDPYDPYYEEAVFNGQVTVSPANKAAEKRPEAAVKCLKKRTVVIRNIDLEPGSGSFATTKTDVDGNYSVDADDAYTEPGTYRSRVTKRHRVHAKVKCFGAKSNEVEVPTNGGGE